MTSAEFSDLDQLASEDPLIRQLLRTMRDGKGMDLAGAVAELNEIVSDSRKVHAAAERIRALAADIQSAKSPQPS